MLSLKLRLNSQEINFVDPYFGGEEIPACFCLLFWPAAAALFPPAEVEAAAFEELPPPPPPPRPNIRKSSVLEIGAILVGIPSKQKIYTFGQILLVVPKIRNNYYYYYYTTNNSNNNNNCNSQQNQHLQHHQKQQQQEEHEYLHRQKTKINGNERFHSAFFSRRIYMVPIQK